MTDSPRILADLTVRSAEAYGDRTAFRIAGEPVSYADIEHRSRRAAAGFQRYGLEVGDTCALMMSSSVHNVTAWFGLGKAGVIEVPVNTAYRGDLLRYVIDQSDSSALVCDAAFVPRIAEVVEGLPKLQHVIVHGPTDEAHERFPGRIAVHPFDDLVTDGRFVRPLLDESDPSVILYTSGTTGPSKGVVLTHAMNLYTAQHTVEICDYDESDVLYTVFPLFHINAKYLSVLATQVAGASLVMDSKFSASGFWDTCRDHGVTAFNYQGALLLMLMKQPVSKGDRDNAVRRAIGAPAPPEIWEQFEDRFGLRLLEIYGMTEIAIATHSAPGATRVGSCGRASEHLDVQILDEYDRAVPPGVTGEIAVRPRRPFTIIQEYYKMPDQTLRAFRNLWFHTGDRGMVDEDGYFHFIDRIKDAIRRRGENISSFEVEGVVNSHEAVLESAAYGVPSELSEEEVMIAVVTRPGEQLAPQNLVDHCAPRMADFAVPRYVRVMDELPKTPSQRVEKYRLREEGITADTWDRDGRLGQNSRESL